MDKIETCTFMEDAEAYIVIGDCTKNEALEAIHNYERKEMGVVDEEELAPERWLKEARFKESKGYIWWSETKKYPKKGWVAYI